MKNEDMLYGAKAADLFDALCDASVDVAIKRLAEAALKAEKEGFVNLRIDVDAEDYWGAITPQVFLRGDRPMTEAEKEKRDADRETIRKLREEHDLREFLRLKEKFDKQE